MFWVEYGYNQDWRSKKQQVHWAHLENEAPKASRFQHVKFSSSDCPIVPRFGFCSYFWKWKPPREKNFLNLIIFFTIKHVKTCQNASKRVKTRQNASKRVKTCQNASNLPKLSILEVETQDFGYLSIFESGSHLDKRIKTIWALFISQMLSIQVKFSKLVNFDLRDPRFGLSAYLLKL